MPSGWSGHVPFGSWLIDAFRPSIFVELGSHYGMSYAALCQTVAASQLPTRCYAVDTWQGDEHAGFYGDEIYNDLSAFNAQNFSGFSSLLRMTFDEARNYFPDETVDLLHIDGLHTYEAVKHDFETWLPKLSNKSIVLFHDTNVRERGFGVWQYWAEISKIYPSVEFDHSAGLGVLFVGKEVAPASKFLLDAAAEGPRFRLFKEVFASLGDSVVKRYEVEVLRAEEARLTGEVRRLLGVEANLSAEVSHLSTEVTRLSTEMEHKAEQTAIANEELGKLSARTRELESALTERETQNAELKRRLAEAERQISSFIASSSYRLTAPLRWIRKVVVG